MPGNDGREQSTAPTISFKRGDVPVPPTPSPRPSFYECLTAGLLAGAAALMFLAAGAAKAVSAEAFYKLAVLGALALLPLAYWTASLFALRRYWLGQLAPTLDALFNELSRLLTLLQEERNAHAQTPK